MYRPEIRRTAQGNYAIGFYHGSGGYQFRENLDSNYQRGYWEAVTEKEVLWLEFDAANQENMHPE